MNIVRRGDRDGRAIAIEVGTAGDLTLQGGRLGQRIIARPCSGDRHRGAHRD